MNRFAWLAATLLATSACEGKPGTDGAAPATSAGPTKEPIDLARARLDAVAHLDHAVGKLEPVTEDKLSLPAGTKLTRGSDPNYDLLFVEQLARPQEPAPVRLPATDLLAQCKKLVDGGSSADLRTLGGCGRLPYLVVVRTRALEMPKVNHVKKSYIHGRFDADVYVLEIETGKSLGGIHVEWDSPETADFEAPDPDGDMRRAMEKTLDQELVTKLGIQ